MIFRLKGYYLNDGFQSLPEIWEFKERLKHNTADQSKWAKLVRVSGHVFVFCWSPTTCGVFTRCSWQSSMSEPASHSSSRIPSAYSSLSFFLHNSHLFTVSLSRLSACMSVFLVLSLVLLFSFSSSVSLSLSHRRLWPLTDSVINWFSARCVPSVSL